jgi:hypothetical protein
MKYNGVILLNNRNAAKYNDIYHNSKSGYFFNKSVSIT